MIAFWGIMAVAVVLIALSWYIIDGFRWFR